MDLHVEVEAMRLLELALAIEPAAREAWLAGQDMPDPVRERLRQLLRHGGRTSGFLESLALDVLPESALPPYFAKGEVIGTWRLLHEIDAGGMGVVYLGERADGSYEQQVAIKFVRLDSRGSGSVHPAELIARFENERRLLARIEHPNVARILDGGRTDAGLPYLVMELVDGVALTEHCERENLDVRARVALFCKVCDGVEAAHRHLIVHRDLKPANILVGADAEPRLLDFGIARVLDAERAGSEQTTTLAMTPAYASPEQVRLEPLTTASDVYSLGVVLYELLAGDRPYSLDGLSPMQSEAVICETTPPSLRRTLASAAASGTPGPERLRDIGGDLERIVAKALHKEPSRRYRSAEAFGEDLRRYLDGRPVIAHPDSLGYRIGKFVRRHRIGTAAAVLALALIGASSALAIHKAIESRRSAADAALINAFLIDVLMASNPYASGSEITLGDALDEAARKVDERFGDRPDLVVDIRNTLAGSMFARYRLEAAETQGLRARADAERVFGPNDPRTVRAISILASVRKDQNRTDEAKLLFDEALRRMEAGGNTATALYGTVLNDMAVMHLVQEDFVSAERYLQRAMQADVGASDAASQQERASTLANMAQAQRGLGHLDRADELYRQAEPVLAALYPQGSPQLAVILNNRARLARVRGDMQQALDLQKQAVVMHQRAFNGDHVMILVPMTNLARQALDAGQPELALEWAEQAVAMADRLYPDATHHYQVNALAALAGTRMARGEPEIAAGLLQRIRTLGEKLENQPKSTRDYVDGLIEDFCRTLPRERSICAPPP